jgi:uncharacterized protein HemX
MSRQSPSSIWREICFDSPSAESPNSPAKEQPMYDQNAKNPRRRMAGLALAALIGLNLVALVALGLTVERGRAELAALSDRLAALSLAAETAAADDPARLAEALAALETKIDALAATAGHDAKAAAALAADVKSLSGRLEALAAKPAPTRETAAKPAPSPKVQATAKPAIPKPLAPAAPQPRYDPRPAYGSGYAAWPVY